MATSWPVSLDTIYGGAVTICQRVEEMSGGAFRIEPFAAGEIVPGLEVLDAVQARSVECGHTASYYYIGKNPAFAFGTAVPFGLSAQQQNTWLYYGGGNEAMNALFADFGVMSFPAGNTGGQLGGWFKKPIENLASLQGLKMRIPGLGGKVMAKLGVNVQVLPGGEIYLALERGTIDAAEFTGPYDDEKLGLAKAAKHYYYPGWWEPGPTLMALVNRKAWSDLPKEYQAMFRHGLLRSQLGMLSDYERRNSEASATHHPPRHQARALQRRHPQSRPSALARRFSKSSRMPMQDSEISWNAGASSAVRPEPGTPSTNYRSLNLMTAARADQPGDQR